MCPHIITITIGLLFGSSPQSPAFENQAISRVQQLNVSQLDASLRERSLSSWLQQVVGPRAGMSWQLTDCGEQAASPGSQAEVQACVEMSALLPDDRKVVILTWVGDFKRGLFGTPKIQFAIVENKGEIFEASRLGDLPQMLRMQRMPPLRTHMKMPIKPAPSPVVLPVTGFLIYPPSAGQPLPSHVLYAESPEIVTTVAVSPQTGRPQKVSEGVLLGNASNKVLPAYPQFAKQLRVSGEVKVEVTIDEGGRVTAAKAISGPHPLRPAAEDAAWKWAFKPTLLNNVPVSVRGVLTFIFTQP
jgi:TonB family protein